MATLYKMVNGERVALTDVETTEIEAEEKAYSEGEKDRNLAHIINLR